MKTKSFTLIEILVVITIISILMGILIPAVSKGMDKARKQKALTAIKTMHMAIKQYETTYGFLPFTGFGVDTTASDTDYTNLLTTLAGTDAASNPRQIKFLQLDKSNEYNDSWGNRLQVALDLDYDGDVDGSAIDTTSPDPLNTTVAVWSYGKDGTPSTATDTDDINSWD